MNFGRIALAITVLASANAHAQGVEDASRQATEYWSGVRDNGRMGPVDYGAGPGVLPNVGGRQAQELAAPALLATPVGRSDAQLKGFFAPPIAWPLIPIHTVLMADGRVLSYGTTAQGAQGAQFIYDIWNPANGVHQTLDNTTRTDIFCSGQSVMANGEVLITGGDLTINGQRNFAIQKTTIFDPNSETIRNATPMHFPRWYPTVVSLTSGDKLVLGGLSGRNPDTYAITPEVFHEPDWRTLTNASSDFAFGSYWGDWYYSKAFTAPNGKVFVLGAGGDMFYLNTAGTGTLTELAPKAPFGDPYFPSLMYAPARVLSLRRDRTVALINLSGAQPTVSTTQSIDKVRIWGNTTVMADGRVFVNGGSAVDNELVDESYTSTIWSPTTGQWTTGDTAKMARLYHSTALLLPDGSVLTAGGGADGPVTNLNAEIYYPPYLFKTDGSGQPAPRPTITNAPAAVSVGQLFGATIAGADTITRVTLVRTGSVTHSFNPDQRYMGLSFTQTGQALSIKLPASRNNLLPGYYLLFVFKGRVPSVARIIQVV